MALPLLQGDWDEIEDWLKDSGTDILVILAVLFVAYLAFRAVFPRLARAAMMRGAHPPDAEMERRADTILGVIDGLARAAVILLATITILPEFGVNITAIVTGLGISGLALALGSQQLVRDGVNGIFLLAEDQYRTGDVVTIHGVTGTVEAITLRRTVVRDRDGVVHSVPNGAIDIVSNHTRDYAQVNVEVRVSVGEDLERVREIIDAVGREMLADPALGKLLTTPPSFQRVAAVGDGGLALVVSARTQPEARWQVSSEVLRRLSEAFVREGVHVPYPVLRRDES